MARPQRGRTCAFVLCLLTVSSCEPDAAHPGGPRREESDAGSARPTEPVPPAPPTGCTLTAAATVLERESIRIGIAAAGCDPPSDLQLIGLPDGAAYDASSRELQWTPTLEHAGRHRIGVRGQGLTDASAIVIDVVDRFDEAANVGPVDPERYVAEYGLPVFHLGPSPSINDDAHEPATLVYQGHRYLDVTAKYRGSTSAKYPKRSYTIRFDKQDLFVDRLRGFRGAQRIVLTTTFDDNAYLRQRLAYELWNRLDHRHFPIRAFNAVVYVDGKYHGLYVVSDHIDDDYFDGEGVYDHANLYKARRHDANFRLVDQEGKPKTSPSAGYTKEEGMPAAGDPDAFADLEALVEWVATAPDDAFAREFDRRMVQREFEDWLIFANVILATDSSSKNHYLYHDPRPDAPEPRWRYLPWDFNASFGQNYRTRRLGSSTYPLADFGRYNELFARMLRDERLRARVHDRYAEALRGPWSLASVLALVDRWAREIEPSALRDEQKWGARYRAYFGSRTDLTTFQQEIAYVRSWIEARWSFVAGGLD